jgi:hypothetical protein
MKFMKLQLLILVFAILATSSAFADTMYSVSIDTSSLSGTDGYLYFQYLPLNAAESTATVSDFIGGLLAASPSANVVDGSAVSGALPGSVTFANTNGVNDYNHGITFGDSLSFLLTFSDPAAGGVDGGSSTFSLGLFRDEGGLESLLNGTMFTLDLVNDGSTSYQTLADEASVSQVPEPGSMCLLGSGLVGLIGLGRIIRN